jgi:DNA polymerase III delta subunit
LLVELCQADLPAIDAEMKKLALYVGEAAGISESDVAASAMSYGAYKPFDVCDKLAAGDRRAALKVVEGLLDEGLPAPVLVGTLRSHFRRLLEARLVADRDGVAAAVSQFARFPKEQDGFRRQLSQFSADDLVRAYGRLLEADLQSKTSRFPDTIIIERLILDLSAPGQGTPSRPRA